MNYKKMYFTLFNAVTDALNTLQQAQQDGERAFIEQGNEVLSVCGKIPLPDASNNNQEHSTTKTDKLT